MGAFLPSIAYVKIGNPPKGKTLVLGKALLIVTVQFLKVLRYRFDVLFNDQVGEDMSRLILSSQSGMVDSKGGKGLYSGSGPDVL
jgi:hypothetical protein